MTKSPLVIVSCTDRKSLPAIASLTARNLPANISIEDAALRWSNLYRDQLKSANTSRLRDLYQGEYWKLAQSIDECFDTLVASAGIGLHPLDDLGTGYNATFTHGVPDSITRLGGLAPIEARQRWWKALHKRGSVGSTSWKSEHAPTRGRRSVFVAVSEGYQHAFTEDLISIANDWANVVIVSGSKPFADLVAHKNIDHIQVGQEIRMLLGGSTPCIGIRFLEDFLQQGQSLNAEGASSHLDSLTKRYAKLPSAKKLPTISRVPFVGDDDAVTWICSTIRKQRIQNPTKSGLLRILRDQGRACEQKRFGALFEVAMSQLATSNSSAKKPK